MNKKRSLAALVFVFLASSSLEAQAKEVRVRTITENNKYYEISEGSCEVTAGVDQHVSGTRTLRYGSTCRDLELQSRLNSRLLGKIFEDPENRKRLSGLLWLNTEASPALASRLLLAAKESPRWDAVSGRAKSGNEGLFLLELAQQLNIFAEFKKDFKAFGFDVEPIGGPEIVLVCSKAEALKNIRPLKAKLDAQDRLPCGGTFWFSVKANSAVSR